VSRFKLTPLVLLIVLLIPVATSAHEPSSRLLDELNWLEIQELVPARINTVLLTTGTVEPHGVINNGADNTAPIGIAKALVADVNAILAPHISYGITGSMSPYPGATYIQPEIYGPYVKAVMEGFVRNGFRNLIVINGHGGPQTAVLQEVANQIAFEHGVNTLVINWWSLCAEDALAVFGNTGGHAAENETAMVQALRPDLVHREWIDRVTATANPPAGTWSAMPFPSTITQYVAGEGLPGDFDQGKADAYFEKVVVRVRGLILEILEKWRQAGFNGKEQP
jgi:creatinine amidohydrolase